MWTEFMMWLAFNLTGVCMKESKCWSSWSWGKDWVYGRFQKYLFINFYTVIYCYCLWEMTVTVGPFCWEYTAWYHISSTDRFESYFWQCTTIGAMRCAWNQYCDHYWIFGWQLWKDKGKTMSIEECFLSILFTYSFQSIVQKFNTISM